MSQMEKEEHEYKPVICDYCKHTKVWISGDLDLIYDIMCDNCNKLRVPSLQFKEEDGNNKQ